MISPKRITLFVIFLDLVLFLAGYREIKDENGMEFLGFILMMILPLDLLLYFGKFFIKGRDK